jgi:hypothetical protein
MSFGEPFQGVLKLRLARGNRQRWGRFNIPSRVLFNLIGRRLERGRIYQISGEVSGIGHFSISHLESGARKVQLSVRREQAINLRFNQVYQIRVTSVAEEVVHNVIDTKYGSALKISLRTLKTLLAQGWHQGSKVTLAFRLRKVGSDLRFIRCFSSYRLGSTDLCLWVDRKGLVPGDAVEISGVERYSVESFVNDFETNRGENLRNVLLVLRGEDLRMQVNSATFALDRPYLTSNALRVILHANLHGTNKEIRFQFDGESIRGCFFKDAPIASIAMHGSILEIAYRKNDPKTFCLYTERFDRSDLAGRIQVEPDVSGLPGVWSCAMDQELGRLVGSRLMATAGTARWSREKGDISEAILAHMLELTGEWVDIALHPQSAAPVGDSHLVGPDLTARSKLTGLLYHFELKWWKFHKSEAVTDARRQARRYLKVYPTHKGEAVSGAFIGILDWDDRETKARFYVKQVA